jgi:NAD+ diphosphatase
MGKISISDTTLWFLFSDDELYYHETSEKAQLPTTTEISLTELAFENALHLGTLGDVQCCGVYLSSGQPVPGLSSKKLRQLHGQLPDPHYAFAFRALHLLNWRKKNQFCGACGGPLSMSATELAAECNACGNLVFPRISPAIIVSIEKGNQILLARSSRFPTGMYSVIAGFVEPGETFEECVRREVKEEVGLDVGNIRYFSSQPWPFPDSLMVGFSAEWTGGDIVIDDAEIVDANWYSIDNLPPLPGKDSIARKLIDNYIKKQKE